MGNLFCRVVELPRSVNAVTVIDNDGNYNVYVNALLPIEEQREAFNHETRHISRNHFYSSKPVVDCENEADLSSQNRNRC